MILNVFFALLAVSMVVCLLAYFTGDEPYLTVGLFLLFLLGIVVLNGNLEYESSATVATNYTYDNGTVTSTATNIQYAYTNWDDSNSFYTGWAMVVLSGIGMGLSFYNTRGRIEQ